MYIIIILTFWSVLYGLDLYDGDIIHVDYLSIPGANLQTLTADFKAEYYGRPLEKPLDVVLVAGYVYAMESFRGMQIVTDFFRFVK